MGKVFGVFGMIGHGLKVGALATWHLIEVIGHDADVIFIDTLKAAQVLGYDKEHILTAVSHAEDALRMYVENHEAGWTAATVQTLQHQFVTDSLIEKLGLSAPLAHTLTTIVSKLYSAGSPKMLSLIDAAVKFAEEKAGLLPAGGAAPAPQVGSQG